MAKRNPGAEIVTTCNMCGECCRWIAFKLATLTATDREYYTARGCKIERTRGGFMVVVPSVCPHLTSDNKCDIHETKPKYCSKWHGSPHGVWIPDTCAFSHKKLSSND